ncbi:MAG: GTPase HflX [Treponemataceae bacterium]|nr:GTPase HflX [Treponemataceae bacterium]
MIDIEAEECRKVRCLLVGRQDGRISELCGLADTLGMERAGTVVLTRTDVQPAYGMGKGKAQEIASLAKESDADCIIFDFDLPPTKQRNWEKLSGIPCFDRQEVILRIFAQRARTKEAVLQVELARLVYSLPRLAHSYGDMARQRGGSYGAKGAGETQLELDQRRVRERIYRTKKELAAVVRTRGTQHKKRRSVPVPECALVGYTNAGKSSLMNALTGADAFVEDKLFATLDPLTRRLRLKDGTGILLTDTVGFISSLPHSLIDAFESTLAEARRADLLLVVIDASDPDAEFHHSVVSGVLSEIGAAENPQLVVLNKIDKIEGDASACARLRAAFPGAVWVSARTGAGFGGLAGRISSLLLGGVKEFLVPAAEGALLAALRADGAVLSEEWLDGAARIRAKVSGRTAALAQRYLVPPREEADDSE